jgi:hypothetical protein
MVMAAGNKLFDNCQCWQAAVRDFIGDIVGAGSPAIRFIRTASSACEIEDSQEINPRQLDRFNR